MQKIILKSVIFLAFSFIVFQMVNGVGVQAGNDLALLQMQNTDLSLYTRSISTWIAPVSYTFLVIIAYLMFKKRRN